MMYFGNLTNVLKLRLTDKEMDFLAKKAQEMNMSISAFVRLYIDLQVLKDSGEMSSNGDTKTYLNNQL